MTQQLDSLADPAVARLVPQAGISLHFIGDESVLFDAAHQRLYAANTTATFIWCCLEEGLAPEAIVRQLEQTFSLSSDEAAIYLSAALGTWRRLELLSPGGLKRSGPATPPMEAAATMADAPAVAPEIGRPVAGEGTYRLLDIDFHVRVAVAELVAEMALVLSPLANAEPAPIRVVLDVIPDGRGYSILRDGRPFQACERDDQVVPLLKTTMIEVVLERSGDFGAAHAAGVGRDGRCVLLPAVSGSGKSTLTAALVAAGLDLLGDDTVVLDAADLTARPVPFSICVKEGAWPLLRDRYPDLEARPVHNRLDGKRVRYLAGGGAGRWAAPQERFTVQALAFIRRIPETKATLVPISEPNALSRLTSEFCLLGEPMTAATVDKLVEWVSRVACYELRYSDLDDAVETVKGLFA